jgi:hypothetical protein
MTHERREQERPEFSQLKKFLRYTADAETMLSHLIHSNHGYKPESCAKCESIYQFLNEMKFDGRSINSPEPVTPKAVCGTCNGAGEVNHYGNQRDGTIGYLPRPCPACSQPSSDPTGREQERPNGAELIRRERERQVAAEGWSAERERLEQALAQLREHHVYFSDGEIPCFTVQPDSSGVYFAQESFCPCFHTLEEAEAECLRRNQKD